MARSSTTSISAAEGRKGTRSWRRGSSRRRVIRKWEEKEVMELSRLILNYKAQCGRLPETSDKAFWALCCERFKGFFSVRQMRDKLRRLKLRYLRLSSGLAKYIKLSEKETFHTWSCIMLDHTSLQTSPFSCAPLQPITTPPQPQAGAPPPLQVADGNDGGEEAAFELSTSPTLSQPHSTQPPHDKAGYNTGTTHAGDGPPAKEKLASTSHNDGEVGGAGVEEQHEAMSTCSTGCKSDGAYTYSNMHFDNDVTPDGVPDIGRRESVHKTLLHHTTIADLAMTTKVLAETARTLAEIVQSHGPPTEF